MWCKFDTQLFKKHWQAKPPQVRQRLCFLAILAWEEQGIPKDFEYLSWATGLTIEALEAVWPEFEAASEERGGKWMMREMWAGVDSFLEKSERAKNAVEKRWNNDSSTTSDTKCITTSNATSNTDKIRLDKNRKKSKSHSPAQARTQADHELKTHCWDSFASAYFAAYKSPYLGAKRADHIHFWRLLDVCGAKNWQLDFAKWEKAQANYFASPQGEHTFADLVTKFSTFYRGKLDRFRKPEEKQEAAVSGYRPEFFYDPRQV